MAEQQTSVPMCSEALAFGVIGGPCPLGLTVPLSLWEGKGYVGDDFLCLKILAYLKCEIPLVTFQAG